MQPDLSHYQPDTLAAFEVETGFSAAKFLEENWKALLQDDIEGYRLHLAFDTGHTPGFKTGYIGIRKNQVLLCIAPYFVTQYALESSLKGTMQNILTQVKEQLPSLMTIKMLCVGSPVTDSCKLAISREYPFDPALIQVLNRTLATIAKKENATLIAFKDVKDADYQLYGPVLKELGYNALPSMPLAINKITHGSVQDYLASLSTNLRTDIEQKLSAARDIRIEEHQGIPPHLDDIYNLYLESHAGQHAQSELLTKKFFEYVAGLMPEQTRFVLYFKQNTLVAFNLLLHHQGVVLDKYIGINPAVNAQRHIDCLSWIHNIEMCIRDGFHTYQSSREVYHTRNTMPAKLHDTHTLLKLA